MDGFLNHTGGQFQKDACSVSGFTGFVLTIDPFVLEITFCFKNVRICMDVAYVSRYGKKKNTLQDDHVISLVLYFHCV